MIVVVHSTNYRVLQIVNIEIGYCKTAIAMQRSDGCMAPLLDILQSQRHSAPSSFLVDSEFAKGQIKDHYYLYTT